MDLPASLRSDGVRDHPGMPFGIPPELAFSFAGIPSEAHGRGELHEILQAHKTWLETNGRAGQRANFGRVTDFNLFANSYKNVDLNGVDLAGADMRKANLRGTDLSGARLGETNNEFGHLLASPRSADLRGADPTQGPARRFRQVRTADRRHSAPAPGVRLWATAGWSRQTGSVYPRDP
jgi:hypothetical protein